MKPSCLLESDRALRLSLHHFDEFVCDGQKCGAGRQFGFHLSLHTGRQGGLPSGRTSANIPKTMFTNKTRKSTNSIIRD